MISRSEVLTAPGISRDLELVLLGDEHAEHRTSLWILATMTCALGMATAGDGDAGDRGVVVCAVRARVPRPSGCRSPRTVRVGGSAWRRPAGWCLRARRDVARPDRVDHVSSRDAGRRPRRRHRALDYLHTDRRHRHYFALRLADGRRSSMTGRSRRAGTRPRSWCRRSAGWPCSGFSCGWRGRAARRRSARARLALAPSSSVVPIADLVSSTACTSRSALRGAGGAGRRSGAAGAAPRAVGAHRRRRARRGDDRPQSSLARSGDVAGRRAGEGAEQAALFRNSSTPTRSAATGPTPRASPPRRRSCSRCCIGAARAIRRS